MSVKKIILVIVAVLLVGGFATVGALDAVHKNDKIKFQEVEVKARETKIKELKIQYDKIDEELNKAQNEKNSNQAEIERLQKEAANNALEKQRLEAELQAKIEAKTRLAKASESVINAATGTQTAAASGIDCGNQTSAKAFIYCHESGNVADKSNAGGCYGLGQDCNGIVRGRCGADYACQDQFFTEYMQRRYVTWEKAKAFWLARVPINGVDVGNWW